MNNNLAKLGQRIRAARLAAGLTLERLGELVGCSHSALSQIENGHCQPTVETLQAIGEHLDTGFVLGKIPKAASAKTSRKAKTAPKVAS